MPIAHFEAIGSDYTRRSISFPWSWLRKREANAFVSLASFRIDDTVLDLGSGSGYYACLFSQLGAKLVEAIDSSPSMIAALPDSIRGLVADVSSLDLEKRFDIVICAGLLEFVVSPQLVFRTARRHIKDNGSFTVLFPLRNFWGWLYRMYHRSNNIDVELFSYDDLECMAKAEGFRMGNVDTVWPFTGIVRLSPA
jgi:SAM-dependent methyltransferase